MCMTTPKRVRAHQLGRCDLLIACHVYDVIRDGDARGVAGYMPHTFMMALEWNGQPFLKHGQGFPALLDWGQVPNQWSDHLNDDTERWQFEMNQMYGKNEYIGPYTMTFGAPQVQKDGRYTGV